MFKEPLLRTIFGIFFLFTTTLGVFAQANLVKQANREYEMLSYANAIDLYEQALKNNGKGLNETEKLQAKIKLAHCYRQVRNTQNSERLYRELATNGQEFTGEDAKIYLYYAQALASNGKYRESEEAYEHYTRSQIDDTRGNAFSKLYKNIDALKKNAASYKVEFLNINTNRSDFSPTYYKKGIVFVSGRGEGVGIKRIFSWDKSAFLDLYYLDDLNEIKGSVAGLGGDDSRDVKTKKGRGLGVDEYTPPTANDSRTIGTYGGTNVNAGLGYGERPESESDKFSKSLNTKYHEGPVTFLHDGSKIFFTRNNYNDGKYGQSSDRVNKIKLYTADEKNGRWGEASELPFNGDEYSTGQPTFTQDDKIMYFVSDMPGGFGGSDLYYVTYNNGNWGKPVNLGKTVNTKGNEMFPFVDATGNLYFASDGLPGLGDLDMFFVEMKDNMPLSKPVNLGAPLNSNKDDFGLITDPERRSGFFSSNRRNGGADDDIYRFSREGSLYACRELTLSVNDVEHKTAVDSATVLIQLKNGEPLNKFTDSDGTTKLCLEPNREYVFKTTKQGYIANTVGYATKGEADDEPSRLEISLQKLTPPPPPSPIEQEPIPDPKSKITSVRGSVLDAYKKGVEGVLVTCKNLCDDAVQQFVTGLDGKYEFDIVSGCDYILEGLKDNYNTNVEKIVKIPVTTKKVPKIVKRDLNFLKAGDVITLDNIYYDVDKWNIRPDAAKELEKLVVLLKKYPNMIVEFGSHTDSRGDDNYNRELSSKRAKAAVEYIAKRGINKSRLIAKGYGETQPVNQCTDGVNCTDAEYQKNRRTTLKILKMN